MVLQSRNQLKLGLASLAGKEKTTVMAGMRLEG